MPTELHVQTAMDNGQWLFDYTIVQWNLNADNNLRSCLRSCRYFARRWPLVTSLRLRARAGSAKRSPTRLVAPGAQKDPHVGKSLLCNGHITFMPRNHEAIKAL